MDIIAISTPAYYTNQQEDVDRYESDKQWNLICEMTSFHPKTFEPLLVKCFKHVDGKHDFIAMSLKT